MANIHLSYSEWAELTGDSGLTNWVKYNWLGGSILPSEYVQLIAIATDSNAYIDTGLIPDITKTYDFYGSFSFHERGDQVILGTREDTSNTRYFPFAIANSGDVSKTNIGYTVYNYGDDVITLDIKQDYETHFKQGYQNWGLVGGTFKTTSMSFEDGFAFTKPMYLFRANHTSPSACRSGVRVYSIKIYEDGNLILDLVPCYRIADNEVGMYDLVSKTFLTNAGSGEFTPISIQ